MFSCILDITQWMTVIDGRRRSNVKMTNHTTIQYSGISEFLTIKKKNSGTPRIKNHYINPKLALTAFLYTQYYHEMQLSKYKCIQNAYNSPTLFKKIYIFF